MADNYSIQFHDGIQETWRPMPIAGFEQYEVSNLGRLRRASLISVRRSNSGYLRAGLSRNNRRHGRTTPLSVSVHRMVAIAFLGPCPEGFVVNHIDGDKRNNRVDNLEYMTPGENQRHAARLGLKASGDRHRSKTRPESIIKGGRVHTSKVTEEQVRQMRQKAADGVPRKEIQKEYGLSKSQTCKIIKRDRWAWAHVE